MLGRLLGLAAGTAARWADTAGGDWARYAAATTDDEEAAARPVIPADGLFCRR